MKLICIVFILGISNIISALDDVDDINIELLISNGKMEYMQIHHEVIGRNVYMVSENILSDDLNDAETENGDYFHYNPAKIRGMFENYLDRYLIDKSFTNEMVHRSSQSMNAIDRKLMEAFYKLRDNFTRGMPDMGIPILDPFKIDDLSTDFKNTFVKANIHINDMNMFGLKDVEANYISLNIIGLFVNFEFTLNSLVIEGKYDLKGKITKIIPLKDSGNIRLQMDDIRVIGSGKIAVDKDTKILSLQDFKLEILNGDVKINLRSNGKIVGKILSKIVQSMTADVARTQKEKLEQEMTTKINEAANKKLSKYTLKSLLESLSKADDNTYHY